MGTEEMSPCPSWPQRFHPPPPFANAARGLHRNIIWVYLRYLTGNHRVHCSFFFFLLLFKANGSESERSTVTPAEMCSDWENRWKKVALTKLVVWQLLTGQHSATLELGGALCITRRFKG